MHLPVLCDEQAGQDKAITCHLSFTSKPFLLLCPVLCFTFQLQAHPFEPSITSSPSDGANRKLAKCLCV